MSDRDGRNGDIKRPSRPFIVQKTWTKNWILAANYPGGCDRAGQRLDALSYELREAFANLIASFKQLTCFFSSTSPDATAG